MMKFNYRNVIAMGFLASVAAMGAGCESEPEYVNTGSLCITIDSIQNHTIEEVQDMDLNVTIVASTQGITKSGDFTAQIIGNRACVTQSFYLGSGLRQDLEISTIRGTLLLDDSYIGFDSAPSATYNGSAKSLLIESHMVLKKGTLDASGEELKRRVNSLLGKGLVIRKSNALASDAKIKVLTDMPEFKDFSAKSAAGSAK